MLVAIQEVIKDSCNNVPGAIRMHHELKNKGFMVSHRRLVSIMRKNGIYHKYHCKYVKTTDSNHNLPRAEDLVTLEGLILLMLTKPGVEILRKFLLKKASFI